MATIISLTEFCRHHHIDTSFVLALEEYGLVQLVTDNQTAGVDADNLANLEQLVRLHRDLQINLEGLHALSRLMEQLEETQAELRQLRNRLRLYES